MSDATYLLIRKLTDTTNLRPLIDIVAGESFLFGKRVLTSPSMPAATATRKPILFGDLSAFYVASTEMQIQVLKERNAEFGQVVVGAGMRIDSRVVAPGSAKPLIYLNMHA
jgi:HK97 family phage major capsid protein